jgi:hypothetical protein
MKNVLFLFLLLLSGLTVSAQAPNSDTTKIAKGDLSWVPAQADWGSIDTIIVKRKQFAGDTTRRAQFIFWKYGRNGQGVITSRTPIETMWIDSIDAQEVMYRIVSQQSETQAAITYAAFQEMQKARGNVAFGSAYRRTAGERLDQTNWKKSAAPFVGEWSLYGNTTAQRFTVADNAVARRNLPVPNGETRNTGNLRVISSSAVELFGYLAAGKSILFHVVFAPNEQNGKTITYMSNDGQYFLSHVLPQ